MSARNLMSAVTLFLMFVLIGHVHAIELAKEAPDFMLKDIKGKERKLSEFRGQYVVLEWFNPECPFVKKHYETKNMQGLQEKYTKKGVTWLLINSSAKGKQGHLTPKEAATWKKDVGAHASAILLDPKGKTGRKYQAKTTPHMYIINPKGHLVYKGAIDDKSSPFKRSVKSAHNYVSAILDLAVAGKAPEPKSTKPYGCSVKY